MVRRFDFLRAVARPAQAKLHVRLSAAQPHVTHQNFVQHHGLSRSDNFNRVRPSGRGGRDFHLPPAVGSRLCRRRPARHFHTNRFPGFRPSPKFNRFSPLQDHIITEHRTDERQGHLSAALAAINAMNARTEMQKKFGSHNQAGDYGYKSCSEKAKSRRSVSPAFVERLAATYSRGSYTTTTIGKAAFDGRVRNGIGSDHSFMATKLVEG